MYAKMFGRIPEFQIGIPLEFRIHNRIIWNTRIGIMELEFQLEFHGILELELNRIFV